MDLVNSNSLWSIHASFQNDDKQDVSKSSNLFDIVEGYNETDADNTDVEDAAADVTSYLPSESAIPSNYYFGQQDTDLEEEETDFEEEEEEETDLEQDEDDDDDEFLKATAHLLGVSSRPPQDNANVDFQPRLQEPDPLLTDEMIDLDVSALLDDETAEDEERRLLSAIQPRKQEEEDQVEVVQNCFEKVRLVSPAFFESRETNSVTKSTDEDDQGKNSNEQNPALSLSSLVHPMDLSLFRKDRKARRSKKERVKSAKQKADDSATNASVYLSAVASAPPARSPSSVLQLEQYTIQAEKSNNDDDQDDDPETKARRSSKLSSSFKSNTHKTRVSYSLSGGKSGMTAKDVIYSKSYLPNQRLGALQRLHQAINENLLAKDIKQDGSPEPVQSNFKSPLDPSQASLQRRSLSLLSRDSDTALSVLLLEIPHKVFEIVSVDHTTKETTVGDVLTKARVQATDPLLSQQTYVSLCNADNEFAALMLPVHLMIAGGTKQQQLNAETNKANNSGSKTLLTRYDQREEKESSAADQQDPSMGRLLMAVPEGSTAAHVRAIQRALWKHPRFQRWWKQENRFSAETFHRQVTI